MRGDYWDQSVQPLYCLMLVGPLLFLYEAGVTWLGPLGLRNGADIWLRGCLQHVGLGGYFLLPLFTCVGFLAWHHVSRQDWKVRGEIVSGMICESFVLGLLVLILAQVGGRVLQHSVSIEKHAAALQNGNSIPYMLSYIGAGIYEELLFRLVMLSGAIFVCRRIGAGTLAATALAVASTSLLFAAAHYELFFDVGLAFTWDSFLFRSVAGALFSLLYLSRGFGIVVGTHVVYDILVATVSR